MPVDSKSVFYDAKQEDWEIVRDILEGERAIKAAGKRYLPILKGQTSTSYTAYKSRGSFFNATARTIQGLAGAVMRKPVITEVPKAMEEWMEKVTLDGLAFKDVVKLTVDALLGYGYFGVLVDLAASDVNTLPFLSLYRASDIFNMRYDFIKDKYVLNRLILGEVVYEDSPDDQYEQVEIEQVRVLELNEGGKLEVEVYRKTEAKKASQDSWVRYGKLILPKVRGKTLNYIPFQFFGSIANLPTPSKPPLIDLMFQNLQHWRLNVDYNHGLHFCALPTPWASGFKKDAKLFIGPEKAWVSEKPDARCGYLEFTGRGLAAIKEALENTEKRMAVLGARLLEEQKRAVEAAETIRIRSSGDSATLGSIANSVELGMTNILKIVAEWLKQDSKNITVAVNKDFVSEKLASQEITALLQAVQAGRISMDTFLYNLKTGEVLPEDRSIDEEKELIEAEGNTLFSEGEEENEEELEE